MEKNLGSPIDNICLSASHYAYDIHGNVQLLAQDIPMMENLLAGQQFKIIAYSYDLVSGNVHQVAYQQGETDQYFHFYESEPISFLGISFSY